MKEDEEKITVAEAIESIEEFTLSIFPEEPHKALALVQASFVRMAMDLYEDDGLLEVLLTSTEEMYKAAKESEHGE